MSSGSQLRVIFLPPPPLTGHLSRLEAILIVEALGGGGDGEWSCWHLVCRGQDAAKQPIMHETAPVTSRPIHIVNSAKVEVVQW